MTQEEILEKLVKDIQLRGLSIHTERGYYAKAKQFMRHFIHTA